MQRQSAGNLPPHRRDGRRRSHLPHWGDPLRIQVNILPGSARTGIKTGVREIIKCKQKRTPLKSWKQPLRAALCGVFSEQVTQNYFFILIFKVTPERHITAAAFKTRVGSLDSLFSCLWGTYPYAICIWKSFFYWIISFLYKMISVDSIVIPSINSNRFWSIYKMRA